MRSEGYYWVKYDGNWTICQWYVTTGRAGNRGMWFMPGDETDREDDYFDEIDENQIVRPIVLGTVVMTPVKLTPEQIKENEEWLKLIRNKDVYPDCSSPEHCNYTGECQQSFIGGKCKYHKEGHKY
jgi:hypothetical protein